MWYYVNFLYSTNVSLLCEFLVWYKCMYHVNFEGIFNLNIVNFIMNHSVSAVSFYFSNDKVKQRKIYTELKE